MSITMALEWQRSLATQTTVVNGTTYFGPHKWIICLVSRGNYHIKQFLKDNPAAATEIEQAIRQNSGLANSLMAVPGSESDSAEADLAEAG